ncbi:MAG: hypothetical protein H7321_03020 [Bacteroidia bacterium]|nr:hypothetical protein [Bacteroidia bacterium]
MFSKPAIRISLILLLYAVLAVAFTWPLAANFSKSYIGYVKTGDSSQYIWNIWHFSHCIKHGLNPFYTHYLFYPEGASLLMHAYTIIAGLLNLALNNPVLSLNTVLIASFIFSAYGMFRLCRHFEVNFFLSISAGFIFSFFPYKTAHLSEHFNLELTACLPYFILFFIKTFELKEGHFFPALKSKINLPWLVLTAIICLLCDYYYCVYLLYFSIIYCTVFYLIPVIIKWSFLKRSVIVCLILFAGHFIIRGLIISGVDDKGALWWSGDLLAFFIPSHFSLAYSPLESYINSVSKIFRYPESMEFIMFIGFALMALYFIAIANKNKVNNRILQVFTISSLIFLLMCFPEVKIAGKTVFYNITGLIYFIPFLNNVRTPPRYELMFVLLSLPWLMAKLSFLMKNSRLNLIIVSLIAITFIEFIPKPYSVITKSDVPTVYRELAKLPAGSLLNIPAGFRDGFEEYGTFNTNNFLYQTIHQKPITGGYLSRVSRETKLSFKTNPTYNEIFDLQKNGKTNTINNFNIPVKYIVVEPQYRKSFEPYLDTALRKRDISKKEFNNYLLYILNR